MDYVVFFIGVYLIGSGLVMKTTNFISSFIFKVFPFFSGAFLMFASAKHIGWI